MWSYVSLGVDCCASLVLVGGLFFDESLGLVVVAVEVLELCVQIALGNQVASVSPRHGAVCPSYHLRIPNDLVSTVVWGSGAG